MLFENIETVIRVERKRKVFDTKVKKYKESKKISYYLSTFKDCTDIMAKIIQEHWGVENKNNYVRDVTLKEDASRIRNNPGIFARLRSFALNILRINGIENIQEALDFNGYDFNTVLDYRGVF
jgi:predicted transposase YbfD/YdcC